MEVPLGATRMHLKLIPQRRYLLLIVLDVRPTSELFGRLRSQQKLAGQSLRNRDIPTERFYEVILVKNV